MIDIIKQALNILTIVGQAIAVILIITLIFRRRAIVMINFVKRHAILLSFIVALTATLGSLFYSEIVGYEPCKLCWFQRIFIYPLVFLFGLALWRREKVIIPYGLVMSAVGFLIAAYHYLLQLGIAPSVNCGVIGYAAACSQRFVMAFGFITIPLMSATAFALIFLLLLIGLRKGSAR